GGGRDDGGWGGGGGQSGKLKAKSEQDERGGCAPFVRQPTCLGSKASWRASETMLKARTRTSMKAVAVPICQKKPVTTSGMAWEIMMPQEAPSLRPRPRKVRTTSLLTAAMKSREKVMNMRWAVLGRTCLRRM